MERAIIYTIEFDSKTDEYLDELEALLEACDAEAIVRVKQSKDVLNPRYYMGKGKLNEIKTLIKANDIDLLVVNDELSGVQTRNLEDELDIKVVDRTNLILDIFALRAETVEAKLQVELAQLSYRLPRLVGMNNYLSREGGGIGTRGPGEQKLETDRRHIQEQIDRIKNKLKEAQKSRDNISRKRNESDVPYVSIIGYTNCGKSTILNSMIRLSESGAKEVLAKDMLFATLQTFVRKIKFSTGSEFIASDTVGFVSNLSTKLVEAFKGTLEELKYADLILHVVDISDENMDLQIETTLELMKSLGLMDKRVLRVYNKVDKLDEHRRATLNDTDDIIYISAKNDEDVKKLIDKIESVLKEDYKEVTMKVPFKDSALVDRLKKSYAVEVTKYDEASMYIKVKLSQIDYNKYKEYVCE